MVRKMIIILIWVTIFSFSYCFANEYLTDYDLTLILLSDVISKDEKLNKDYGNYYFYITSYPVDSSNSIDGYYGVKLEGVAYNKSKGSNYYLSFYFIYPYLDEYNRKLNITLSKNALNFVVVRNYKVVFARCVGSSYNMENFLYSMGCSSIMGTKIFQLYEKDYVYKALVLGYAASRYGAGFLSWQSKEELDAAYDYAVRLMINSLRK